MSGALANSSQLLGDPSLVVDVLNVSHYLVSGQPSTEQCIAALLLGLVALAWALPELLEVLPRALRRDAGWLAAWSAGGLALRLLGGVRIPAYPNSNGFNMLNNLLGTGTHFGNYGNGPDALYTLVFALVPPSERAVVAVQLTLSVALIPLTYAVWRAWSGSVQGARWSAAIAALLPAQVFFATTEEVLVPATFFLMLALLTLGLALRLRLGALLLSSVLLAAFAVQFRVNLLILPLLLALFVLASPQGRALARRPVFWLAALLLCGLLTTSVLHVAGLLSHGAAAEDTGVAMQLEALAAPYLLLRPMSCDARSVAGNALLAPCMAPPLLPILALLAVAAWRRTAAPVLATLAAALALTWTGLVTAHMNTARLQLPAQPLYALLAGEGLALVLAWLQARRPAPAWHGTLVGTALLGASVALWPGPIGRLFTPQHERSVAIEAMSHLPDHCSIVHAGVGSPPSYLSADNGRHHEWNKASGIANLQQAIQSGCWLYYRSHRCNAAHPSFAGAPDMAATCSALERQLQLEPLFVRAVPALSDNVDVFSSKTATVGFYRVRATAATAAATARATAR